MAGSDSLLPARKSSVESIKCPNTTLICDDYTQKNLTNSEAANVPRPLPVTLPDTASFFLLYSPVCLIPSVVTCFTLRLKLLGAS